MELAGQVAVIICDEVTSALDQIVQEGIPEPFDRLLCGFGLAYLFIMHDLATVRAITDEAAVMQLGKVVATCPKNEMVETPHEPYPLLLLSSIPKIDPDRLIHLLSERAQKRG